MQEDNEKDALTGMREDVRSEVTEQTKEENKEEKKDGQKAETKGKKIARIIFLVLGNAVIIAGVWQAILFNGVSVAGMIFQLMVPMEGADGGNFVSLNIAMAVGLPVMTVLEVLFGNWWRRKTTKLSFFRKRKVLCAGLWFALAAVVVLARMNVFSYLWLMIHPSTIYEENCVAVDFDNIKAPEKKRNLIYIFMESMEITYADRDNGGLADRNRIPYLTEISKTFGDSFSADGKLNGLEPVEGAVWTCGSLVSQTSGVPLLLPIDGNSMGNGYKEFLPGAVTIGEVLDHFGYQQVYLQGSKIEFAGTDLYLKSHGNYEIRDYNYYNRNHKLPTEDYFVWWGFEDFRLYEFAKEEITRLSMNDAPFAVTMMTIDTHFTGGYTCPLCEKKFNNSYDNAIYCADCQLRDFFAWIASQDFYDNTTVVVVGDHPTMDSMYYRELSKGKDDYQRKAYAVVLNSAIPYTLGKTRDYSAFDMFPTTLAAMGFEIKGNRLGLGVNLYSEEQTLVEKYGLKKLNKELLKHSKYYDKHIIGGK
ncbi:MAG: sulfatase-like hydrolase/transferase [Lachnospiraceae bacterium]|nr:sulfatase-like hydrolase/transferase [Lachnospiraceae bacterium]